MNIKKGTSYTPHYIPPPSGTHNTTLTHHTNESRGFKGTSPSYVVPHYQITVDQLKHAIEIVCYKLLVKFRFGPYELDDMKQEAYILALDVLRSGKYDEGRPLTTFLYVHIHNRLYNFKRKHYARITPPCSNCPLKVMRDGKEVRAFLPEKKGVEPDEGTPIPTGGCCLLYNDLAQCNLYAGWLERNEAKRQLAHVAEVVHHPNRQEPPPIDSIEYLDWIQAQLPPQYISLYINYRAGKRINSDAFQSMITWIQENILLDYP